jgi:hypothetical protein
LIDNFKLCAQSLEQVKFKVKDMDDKLHTEKSSKI